MSLMPPAPPAAPAAPAAVAAEEPGDEEEEEEEDPAAVELAEILDFARASSSALASMAFCLRPSSLPGSSRDTRFSRVDTASVSDCGGTWKK